MLRHLGPTAEHTTKEQGMIDWNAPKNYRWLLRFAAAALVALIVGALAKAPIAEAQTLAPPPRVCAVQLVVKSGEDDLRSTTGFDVWLRLRPDPTDPVEPNAVVTPLVSSNYEKTLYGGIPRQQERRYWLNPAARCVKSERIVGVEVFMRGGQGSWPQNQDNWDLTKLLVTDSSDNPWPYLFQQGDQVPGTPSGTYATLARFTGSHRGFAAARSGLGNVPWRPLYAGCNPGAC